MFVVGDTITTHQGHLVTLTRVEPGEHGIMVVGNYEDGLPYGTYVPYELPPPERVYDQGWRGFAGLYWFEVHGCRFPAISLRRRDQSGFKLAAYELAWQQARSKEVPPYV